MSNGPVVFIREDDESVFVTSRAEYDWELTKRTLWGVIMGAIGTVPWWLLATVVFSCF